MRTTVQRGLVWAAAATMAGGIAVAVPATAGATTSCKTPWGSTAEHGGRLSTAPLTAVRAGRHTCYDRLVLEMAGSRLGYDVRYVTTAHDQAGNVLPLRGGARIEIVALDPAYDSAGHATYSPSNPRELVSTSGYRTFRQVRWGGSFEGYTTVGLGVRARLPFRVMVLAGPGTHSRLVIDVAHHW
jgi:hypothetical protein